MAKLTPKERIIRTIKHEEVDMHPVQIDFTPSALDKLSQYFELQGEQGLLDVTESDIIYAYLNDPYGQQRNRATINRQENILYDEWGIGWDNHAEGANFRVHPLKDMEKWESYQLPDPNSEHLMDIAIDTIKKYGGTHFICSYQNILLFERAWALRGLENFMCDMVVNRDFAEELLDKIADYQAAVARRYVALGVDGARTGDDYGAQKGLLFSPKLWREMIKPRLQRIWDVYLEAGIPIIHHTCGDVTAILDDMVDMGLSVLHPVQPEAMDIEYLKKRYGKNLTFYGGIGAQSVLPFGTPEDVDNTVRHCVEVLGKGGGYIIAPSQHITSDVPLENIIALVKAIRRYRTLF